MLVSGAAAGAPVSVQAQGADANIGLALTPRGTGALSAQAADGAVSGGAARGANAVDWQGARAAAAQVASGAQSAIGGGANNTASGLGATVAGGAANAASGPYSWSPGGSQGDARGLQGKGVWASGRFAANGDAQAGAMVLRRQAADATPAALTADGGAPGVANQVVLPNNSAFACRVLVVAKETGGAGAKAAWEFVALPRRNTSPSETFVTVSPGGGAAQASLLAAGNTAGWTVTVGADIANGALSVIGTGAAGATIKWVARIFSTEVVG